MIHIVKMALGLLIMYLVAKLMPYRILTGLSKILLPVVGALLVYTLASGHSSGNASRWILIGGVSFQTSALAAITLYIYLARTLALMPAEKKHRFWGSSLELILPIAIICGLILPANFSTAFMLFGVSCMLLFVGGYPLINLLKLAGLALGGLLLFILVTMAFPQISNRVDTWKSRLESYRSGNTEDNYQVHKAKLALAEGRFFGKGPGKSVQKNFLPQSDSDFIYAIIVEEFGTLGGLTVLALYLLLFIRILAISTRAPTRFGALLTYGLGLGIMMQALINMGVAVNFFPVTGQTLPLISSGGTSFLVNSLAIGIILSVSKAAQTQQQAETQEEPGDVEFAEAVNLTNHE